MTREELYITEVWNGVDLLCLLEVEQIDDNLFL